MKTSKNRFGFAAVFGALLLAFSLFGAAVSMAQTVVDIYGPGQNQVNLAMAAPLTAPSRQANNLGTELHSAINSNLAFLPFMHLTSPTAVLGGTVLEAWKDANLDFRRFQLAGADLLITAYWPNGDGNNSTVELRLFETSSGSFLFGNAYQGLTSRDVSAVADRFCAELLEHLTGSGDFFRSTLAFAKSAGQTQRDIWLVKPTGKDLRQITNIPGTAMSPSWSPDGRYVVFSSMDDSTHALGVWDRVSNNVSRIRFPGNTVIGPSFMPNNQVAVGLSTDGYPDIFLLSHSFAKERALESNSSINVSPSFDLSGRKMVFTSDRLGGPQIFIKDLPSGVVTRVSLTGGYNTEGAISPDGTLVAFTRLTDSGHRIFVQDLITNQERQVTFGPGRDEHPSWCGDNYFLAFSSSRSGQSQIYLTTRHGGAAVHVPTGAGDATFPNWGKIPQ